MTPDGDELMLLTSWEFEIPDAPPSAAWRLVPSSVRALWMSRRGRWSLPVVGLVVVLAGAAAGRWMVVVHPGNVVAASLVGLVTMLAVMALLASTIVITWLRLIVEPHSRVLMSAFAVTAAIATTEGDLEVWTLVNHSAFQIGERHGRDFRAQIWPGILRAIRTGKVEARLRTSAATVRHHYLTELRTLGYTLTPSTRPGWERLAPLDTTQRRHGKGPCETLNGQST